MTAAPRVLSSSSTRAGPLTGNTGPVNPPAMMLASNAFPTFFGSVDAPMTATEAGRSRLATLRASDARSRALRTDSRASVGSMVNSTCTVEPSKLRDSW